MPSVPRLRPNESTVLIIDMQEKLVPAMFEGERIVRNAALILRAAKQFQIPIVATEQNPCRLGPTVSDLGEHLEKAAVLPKMRFSAFSPELQTRLEASGRRTVLLCGIETHVCVLQTALDLLEAGYFVFAAYDAISSRQEHNRKIGGERLRASGVLSSSTEMCVFEWLETAESPYFKGLLPHIK